MGVEPIDHDRGTGAPSREPEAWSAALHRLRLDGAIFFRAGSPIRHLTDWRMHLAEELLLTTSQPVGTVARRVGYDSEEAFSRAFKRLHSLPPAAWRRSRASSR